MKLRITPRPSRTTAAVPTARAPLDRDASAGADLVAQRRRLVADMTFEVVPMTSIEQAITDLPPASRVSVTCSPTRGIEATQRHMERLLGDGHRPIPHLAARLVESPEQAIELADWVRSHALTEVFVIAGDAPVPSGPYDGAVPFLRDFLAARPGAQNIGVAGYPDGSSAMDSTTASDQLRIKQALLAEHGVGGWVSTQMCFDPATILHWLGSERANGIGLPVRLGIAGVVDRGRLLKMGTRLGIGASLRYLSKNRSSVTRMLAPGGYDPTDLIDAIAPHADRLGVDGLHCFTFNAVHATAAWRDTIAGSSLPRNPNDRRTNDDVE